MNLRTALVALSSLTLFACGPQDLTLDEAAAAHTSSGASLTTSETKLTFTGDWNISRSNLFVKGQTVRVSYDANRLPQCRGEFNGKPAWSITGYWRLNGGPIQSFEAGGLSPSNGTQEPVFELTESGELALWFHVTNRWGCSAWDSKFGNNYRFEVLPPPTARFLANWDEVTEGVPGSMPTFTLDYDLARLPHCRQTYNGAPTWEVLAHYRFDGGKAQYKSVTTVNGFTRTSSPTEIEIPAGAKVLEVWFQNTDRAGCVGWDSNFGANYKFRVN